MGCKLNLRSKLREITNALLNTEEDFGQAKLLADSMYELFSDTISLDIYKEDNREGIYTASGKAISVFEAAHCTKEFMRTRQFLRGIYSAILEAQKEFPNEKIRICYAGTGPFATLMIPITTLFNPHEVQFTLMEINKETIGYLKQSLTYFDALEYVEQIIEADASTYQFHEKGKHHILLTETMQQALKKEPQVAITLNLLPQMHERCILVPENIVIDLAVIDSKRNMDRMLGNVEAIDDYLLKLGNVLRFNKEFVYKTLNKVTNIADTSMFPCHSIQCQSGMNSRFKQVYLMTEIQVFKDVWLSHYQCSLNLPFKIAKDTQLVDCAHQLNFFYELNDMPRINWGIVKIMPITDRNHDILMKIFEQSRFDLAMIPDKALQKQIMEQQYIVEKNQLLNVYPLLEWNLICLNNELVGRIYINEEDYEFKIVELGVLEAYRKLGLGNSAMNWLKERALSKGKTISLQVAWFNQGAKCFYEKMGFEVTSHDEVFCQMRWQ